MNIIMPDWNMENQLFAQGYRLLAGIDEAGRGPLAGPVVAALVVVHKNHGLDPEEENVQAIKDAKQLTPKKREKLFQFLKNTFPISVGICDNRTIDRVNIRQATFLAMKKTIGGANPKPEFLLLD